MLHIILRFFLHYITSTFITLAFFFGLRFWRRHNAKAALWIAPEKQRLLLLSGLCVFAIFPLREAFDNAFLTQVWYKAITDDLSWLVGPGTSVWGLYRFDYLED